MSRPESLGNGDGHAGDPDITGAIRGRHLELEVKKPGGRATALQLHRLEQWREAGAIAAVVTSVADVENQGAGLGRYPEPDRRARREPAPAISARRHRTAPRGSESGGGA